MGLRAQGLAIGIALLIAPFASAQDGPAGVSLELNRTSDGGDGTCQMVFLGQNGLGEDLDDITLRLALIDATGVFQNMLSLPFGKLGQGKRRFAQFNLPTPCDDISEIIVNDVASCKVAGEDSDACLSTLTVSSRAAIGLGL